MFKVLTISLLFLLQSCGVWLAEWNADIKYAEMKGEGLARLAQSESEKRILIEEAKAKLESAKLFAKSEVERAKGVAEANRIIGASLKGNEGYLRYLYISNLENAEKNGSVKTIYIPTEAGLPILEARGRR